mgnify:CR=1 FL=1
MTGIGQSKVLDKDFSISCSIKSVNQKGLDIKCRLGELNFLESKITAEIAKKLNRGRVDVEVVCSFNDAKAEISIDENKARSLLVAINDFTDSLKNETVLPISMGELLSLPGMLKQKSYSFEQVEPLAMKALVIALDDLYRSRVKEGQVMGQNLLAMIKKSQSYIKEIGDQRTKDVQSRFQKLKSRCDELFSGYNINLERIYQESALLAERSDFTEELDRLVAHVDYFNKTCEADLFKGRKLDFLCQEMLRESNTLLSKAFDHQVSILGIELRAEIEKIREQVQNIE